MRIVNLDVDDMYLNAQPKQVSNRYGEPVEVLAMSLGDQINDNINSEVFFSGNRGWNIIDNRKFMRGSFTVRNISQVPCLWDNGVGTSLKEALLFTGNYSKDGNTIIADTTLIGTEEEIAKIKVIAGGKKGDALNLLLQVPATMYYEIDGETYNCSYGENVKIEDKSKKERVALEAIIAK